MEHELALTEKLGSEHSDLMIGASCPRGNRNTLLDVAASQIARDGNKDGDEV